MHRRLVCTRADMNVGYLLKNVLMRLDDLEDDVAFLEETVWGADDDRFPPTFLNDRDHEIDLYNENGYKWALTIARNGGVFISMGNRARNG